MRGLPLLEGEGQGEVCDLFGGGPHLTPALSFQEREPVAPHVEPAWEGRTTGDQICESSTQKGARKAGVRLGSLAETATCRVVVLAAPVSKLAEVVSTIGPHLRPGALVLDVGSVKMVAARIMADGLPDHVEIVATHPLFGPQSARSGVKGLKIAVCPIRGRGGRRAAAFLRKQLGLDVILTDPEAHDRAAASVQGLTHLIAKVFVEMEPLPTRMTTKSFDLLMQAVGMVRHDAPEVFDAIERANPYAADVRRRFFAHASRLEAELSAQGADATG
ncbi:prephenate dehydrogenase/arogenate dehydrogenase family protein [Methylobacterium bullatum]|uniref:prephenate dehydrogenase/arogenate dehydrogenase family protein n=1 Tax=Methylobacterium bullatum TaxID=570505 RepID=UPI00246821E1|nr:prephenate dehydrogenase/arogenate dehydrogenase family protein [Methylobacterium bullatum]